MDDGMVFEIAAPNGAKAAGRTMTLKSIAHYSFDETSGQWTLEGRTRGSSVTATFSGLPEKYVLEWGPGGGFIIVVR